MSKFDYDLPKIKKKEYRISDIPLGTLLYLNRDMTLEIANGFLVFSPGLFLITDINDSLPSSTSFTLFELDTSDKKLISENRLIRLLNDEDLIIVHSYKITDIQLEN